MSEQQDWITDYIQENYSDGGELSRDHADALPWRYELPEITCTGSMRLPAMTGGIPDGH